MIILKDRLTVSQLSEIAAELYVDMIKAVADVRLGTLAITFVLGRTTAAEM